MEIESAETLFQAGHYSEVERLARESLRTDRRQEVPWTNLLALSLAAQARTLEARDLFKQLARLQPDNTDHLINLGNACLDAGEASSAEDAFEQARRKGAASVAYLLGHGLALMARAKFQAAEALLSEARRLDEGADDVRLAYAQCLAELEQFDRLEPLLGPVVEEACTPQQRRVLAWLLAKAGLDERAVELYQRLLSIEPDDVDLRIELALLFERLNRLQEASNLLRHECFRCAAPNAMEALVRGRLLRRRQDMQGAIACLHQGVELASEGAMQSQLQFELAKCHEASDQPDECMASLALAHAQSAKAFEHRFPQVTERNVLGWLDEKLERQAPVAWRMAITDESPTDPVFLVGFPRSGTTLLERVLDSHPALDVLDERPALEVCIRSLKRLPHWERDILDTALHEASPAALSAARAEYWREARKHIAPRGRMVDKYPLYLTRVPYVARLFPQAAWLLMLRHPCDCVLSCHMQAFGLNGGALVFRSLESTAEAYAAVMEHWTSQLAKAPMPVHAIHYEAMVRDFHGTLDNVMDFLSLKRVPDQDDFSSRAARLERRINTPSYSQVILPINESAVGRWRRYEKFFSQKALDALRPWVERYGYGFD